MNAQTLSFAKRAEYAASPVGKRLLQLMDDKKTNLALSADVTSSKDLLFFADQLGPEICLLKTHIDIIDDFTFDLTKALRRLADKHHFLIFEDRKFADIGQTVKHQFAGGIYRMADWADMVNAHVLPGPGVIKGLASVAKENQGLILLAEMSSQGHLMNAAYIQETLKMAEAFPEFVMGFITQHALSDDPKWINFTPGIKRSGDHDALGQQYITPKEAILKQGTDVIIVGRGILAADDPVAEAKRYREEGWKWYGERAG